LDRAEVPGSVLVIADAVAPSQQAAVVAAAPDLPVQFLSVMPPNAPVDSGLEQAARARSASVTRLTIDTSDVDTVAGRAQSDFRAAPMDDAGERWRDAGYWLLPVIAILALAWSRKGWVIS
jgi:Ca-activated chloride channel family protein